MSASDRTRTSDRNGIRPPSRLRWTPVLVAVLIVMLAACASRPGSTVLEPADVKPGGRAVTIFVATLRTPEPGTTSSFNSVQLPTLRFARYVVSIPPAHRPGAIEWPRDRPDRATDFVTIESARLSEGEFRSGIVAAQGGGRSVRLFVHGYNNSYPESIYRLAQIAADAHDDRVAVLFAWPSKASALAYAADRAAASASTDGLARTIEILAQSSGGGDTLLAHSMGAWLTVQTLSKMSPERRQAVFARYSNIVLAAPDIDVAEMVRRLETIGRLPRPLTLLVSSDDKALTMAGILTGGRRVGVDDVHDPWVQAAAKRYGVRVVDISELTTADSFLHGRFTAMVALYSKFQSQIENPSGRHFAGPGVFVFRARTSTLEPIGR